MNKVNYLRLSVTDRCNLRCIYCMPYGKDRFIPHDEILRYEEMAEAVALLAAKGVDRVRVTGGEPLMRLDVEDLVGMLKKIKGIKEVSMTTNGVLLPEKLEALLANGLTRINVSLNTLKKKRYKRLTGVDAFERVRSSVEKIVSLAALPLKINVVVLKGINDDEVEDFADFALESDVEVRFIEYFPTGKERVNLQFVPNPDIRRRIERRFGRLVPAPSRGKGPAEAFRIEGRGGRIGFINTRTGDYCNTCSRLRLSSEGRLYPCLFSAFSLDVKKMLRENAPREEILKRMETLICRKSDSSKRTRPAGTVEMSSMGG
jgi:cyclic pyranopterin phosphate synthase